jgi:hypothetical protein
MAITRALEAYHPVEQQRICSSCAGRGRNAAQVPKQPHDDWLRHELAQLRWVGAVAAA